MLPNLTVNYELIYDWNRHWEFRFWFVRARPKGVPPKNSRRPRRRQGQRGVLEIVFNQQLTRLGFTSLAASLPQAQRCFSNSLFLCFVLFLTYLLLSALDVGYDDASICYDKTPLNPFTHKQSIDFIIDSKTTPYPIQLFGVWTKKWFHH